MTECIQSQLDLGTCADREPIHLLAGAIPRVSHSYHTRLLLANISLVVESVRELLVVKVYPVVKTGNTATFDFTDEGMLKSANEVNMSYLH